VATGTAIGQLLDELERNYRETQERLSDPAVYNDHREVADAGRKLKELEGPYRLAQRWREARADLDDALEDSDLRELVAELQERLGSLEEELKVALVETDPADSKDVIIEIRQGVGGGRKGWNEIVRDVVGGHGAGSHRVGAPQGDPSRH